MGQTYTGSKAKWEEQQEDFELESPESILTHANSHVGLPGIVSSHTLDITSFVDWRQICIEIGSSRNAACFKIC